MENLTVRLDILNNGCIIPLCFIAPDGTTIRVDRILHQATIPRKDNTLSYEIICRCNKQKIVFEIVPTAIGLRCTIKNQAEYLT